MSKQVNCLLEVVLSVVLGVRKSKRMCCWTVVAWMLTFHLIWAKNKEHEGEVVDCMCVLNFQFSVNVLLFF